MLACLGALASASCFARPSDDVVHSGQVSGALDDSHKCGLWIRNGTKRVFWSCSSNQKLHVNRDYMPSDKVLWMLHGRPSDVPAHHEPRRNTDVSENR